MSTSFLIPSPRPTVLIAFTAESGGASKHVGGRFDAADFVGREPRPVCHAGAYFAVPCVGHRRGRVARGCGGDGENSPHAGSRRVRTKETRQGGEREEVESRGVRVPSRRFCTLCWGIAGRGGRCVVMGK